MCIESLAHCDRHAQEPSHPSAAVIDLTHPVEDAWTYPGDPSVRVEPHATHAADGYRVSRIAMGTHAGTHVDAPAHTERDGATLGAIPVERFRWTARRVDCTDRGAREAVPPERVPDDLEGVDCLVVHTGWDDHWRTGRYHDHPHLAPETARRCADRGVDVAIDAPSVDPTPAVEGDADGDTGEPNGPEAKGHGDDGDGGVETGGDGLAAHHALLGSGRLIVENLRNLGEPPERFRLHAPPLSLDADAAPVRAVAVAVADG